MDRKWIYTVYTKWIYTVYTKAYEPSRFWKDKQAFVQHEYLAVDFAIKNLYQISTINSYFTIEADYSTTNSEALAINNFLM